jgi:hypothetical protein
LGELDLLITCYKNNNDGRYYVPVIVSTAHRPLLSRFRMNFLVDTGSPMTHMSSNDATSNNVDISSLPRDNRIFNGVVGQIRGYLLPQSTLIFKSNTGIYSMPVGELSIYDYKNINNDSVPSVIGIDIISQFDLLFEEEKERMYLRL